MTSAAKLRALLRDGPIVAAPGAYDGLTARLIAQAGFGTGPSRNTSAAASPACISRISSFRKNAAIWTARSWRRWTIFWPKSAPPPPPGGTPIS
jgi:hypothetical protein